MITGAFHDQECGFYSVFFLNYASSYSEWEGCWLFAAALGILPEAEVK